MPNYTPVTVIRNDTEGISQTQIVDGQILFDTEGHKLYMDNGSSRDAYGGGGDEAVVISYADFQQLTPQQQETGKWLVTGMPPMVNAYSIDYKSNKNIGQELDAINEDLSELNTSGTTTVDLASGVTAPYNLIQKKGKTITVNIEARYSATSSDKIIGNIPDGYRPTAELQLSATGLNGSSQYAPILAILGTNGDITIKAGQTTYRGYILATYVVN